MSTPEGLVKERVKRVLRKHNAYWHMPVQNGMGAPSLDFVCCHRGRYFAVETKAGNKQPTPRQRLTMDNIENAGGKTFVVNDESGLECLDWWLGQLD